MDKCERRNFMQPSKAFNVFASIQDVIKIEMQIDNLLS